eukprot:890301-Rhodomonas_salina.5
MGGTEGGYAATRCHACAAREFIIDPNAQNCQPVSAYARATLCPVLTRRMVVCCMVACVVLGALVGDARY